MIKEYDLKKEFEKMQPMLAGLKSNSAAKEEEVMFSKGPYFDFPVFSYQRSRMQQGRLIVDVKKLKNYNNVYRYSFDSVGKLICAGWGNRLGQFSSIFYLYDEDDFLILSYAYDELEHPGNVTSYGFLQGGLVSLRSYGLYGVREEEYIYSDNLLRRVDVYMRGHEDEKAINLSEYFYYDDVGILKSIDLSYGDGEYETIYSISKKNQDI